MGEITGIVDLLAALFRLFGLESNALLPAIALLMLFFMIAFPVGLLAQGRRVHGGREGMIGETGRAVTDVGAAGRVFVHSEYWNATAAEPVSAGDRVRVVSVDGMTLRVERLT